jgi:hypothetical protein
MSVAEVRKALSKIRARWAQSTVNNPLFISEVLVGSKTIADFCTEFVYGHHLKRHFKSQRPSGAVAADDASSTAPASASASTADAVDAARKGVGCRGGVPGPKGDSQHPFPFSPGWKPIALPDAALPAQQWWKKPLESLKPSMPAPTNTESVPAEPVELWPAPHPFPAKEQVAAATKSTRKRTRAQTAAAAREASQT